MWRTEFYGMLVRTHVSQLHFDFVFGMLKDIRKAWARNAATREPEVAATSAPHIHKHGEHTSKGKGVRAD